jgi:hypothetical protein
MPQWPGRRVVGGGGVGGWARIWVPLKRVIGCVRTGRQRCSSCQPAHHQGCRGPALRVTETGGLRAFGGLVVSGLRRGGAECSLPDAAVFTRGTPAGQGVEFPRPGMSVSVLF